MRIEEARWIQQAIAAHIPAASPGTESIALNLGSGTRRAREVLKPHIDSLTLEPLRAKGYKIIHADLMIGDGIDISGDLFDPAFQKRLHDLAPRIVMFCNVLEHLPARLRDQVPAAIDAILPEGGYLFVTVPYSYPYHADPIDTMYRPSPTQVTQLFSATRSIASDIVESETYMAEFSKGTIWRRVRKILRLAVPIVRPRRWLSHAHRMLWLWRPYRVTAVLMINQRTSGQLT